MDVYRTTGRGGAGNVVKPKQVDEASKDLEAQHLHDSDAPMPDRAASAKVGGAPAFSRGGRGGSGNYVDSASAREHEEQAASSTAAAVADSHLRQQRQHGAGPQPPRLGGRGGAGNWQDSSAIEESRRREEEERRRAEDLERLAREEVDKGLKMPDKVHHGVEKIKDLGHRR